jgi:hypothetical protein
MAETATDLAGAAIADGSRLADIARASQMGASRCTL